MEDRWCLQVIIRYKGVSTWSRCKQGLVGIKLSDLVKATGRLVEDEGHK